MLHIKLLLLNFRCCNGREFMGKYPYLEINDNLFTE